jgi:hypothetical protein
MTKEEFKIWVFTTPRIGKMPTEFDEKLDNLIQTAIAEHEQSKLPAGHKTAEKFKTSIDMVMSKPHVRVSFGIHTFYIVPLHSLQEVEWQKEMFDKMMEAYHAQYNEQSESDFMKEPLDAAVRMRQKTDLNPYSPTANWAGIKEPITNEGECEWVWRTAKEGGNWEAACKHEVIVFLNILVYDYFKYCPFCGKKIKRI